MHLHSLTEAAAASGISLPTLMRRLRDGRGPATIRNGRLRLVPHAALTDWLAGMMAA